MHITRRTALALMVGGSLARARAATDDEIRIGALLSLTGNWSNLGQTSRVLLQIAAAEANEMLAGLGSASRVKLVIEDTRLDPAAAALAARSLIAGGSRILIGPQSSSEAAAVREVLATAGGVAISHGSTASALSLSDDSLYRFVPDDTLEAQAMVAMLKSDGIRTLIPVWRADAGNEGLAESVRRLFTAAGGRVTPGAYYGSEITQPVSAVGAEAARAATEDGIDRVGIYLAAFDEVVDVFRVAAGDPLLYSLRWYGSDGVALSSALKNDVVAARFAAHAGFPAPTLGLPEEARTKWEPLAAGVRKAIGIEPDAYAMAAYDAFWCALLASLEHIPAEDLTWKSTFLMTADSFFGATGWGRLNGNGDRAISDFDFWALREKGGALEWNNVACYDGLGNLTRREVTA